MANQSGKQESEIGQRPAVSAAQIRAMCWGLLGVQFVWGLQNVNTSRIFQTLGADLSELPILWIAAPVSGLLVQPVVGYLSDHTRTPLGRRRPYMIVGAVLTAVSMMVMANAETLWWAVAGLWLLTASVNVVMHPFRALIADNLGPENRNYGYAMQVIFIGAGAVIASALPWMLSNWLNVSNESAGGMLPKSLVAAFEIGACILLLTVGWTVLRTREIGSPPARVERSGETAPTFSRSALDREPSMKSALIWIVAGAAIGVLAALFGIRRELYLISAIVAGFGVAQFAAFIRLKRGDVDSSLLDIVIDIVRMPAAMRRLGIVQFFAWFGLFTMWVYAVPAITARHFIAAESQSASYNAGADWVGVLFALYDGVAVLVALVISAFAARLGLRRTLCACLMLGGAGMLSLVLIERPDLLWVSSIGIGFAWAAILSIPYTIVANSVPAEKIGVYMGIHNIFLVIPQLVGASVLGLVMDRLFAGEAVFAIALASLSFCCAGAASFLIPGSIEPVRASPVQTA